MKANKLLPFALLITLTGTSTISAAEDQPPITGAYEGTYQLTMRSSIFPIVNEIQGVSEVLNWSWVFDEDGNGTVIITDGEVTQPDNGITEPSTHKYFTYTEGTIIETEGDDPVLESEDKSLELVHNGDTSYTLIYHFLADYPLTPMPQVDTYAELNIIQADEGSLTITTLDADGDGVLGKKLSERVYPFGEFPMGASPSWVGTAY